GLHLDHEDLEQLDVDGLEMASRHDFNEIEEGTLLESANQKEIKTTEEEMQGTLDLEQKIMGEDLENKKNLKLRLRH
ncbi:hypothetical protein Tco_0346041, partial [Tanacetum coccineum]